MIKWIIRILLVLIAMAGVSYYAMYQVGNRIIDQAIDQQLAQLDQLEQQLQQPAATDSDLILSEAKNLDTPENNPSAATDPSVILSEAKNPNTRSQQPQKPATTDPNVSLSEAKNLTRSQLEEAKDKINPGDKVSIANLVLKKLNGDDITELTNMISGGLTLEEKKRAKEIAYSRFNQDEISAIIELYAKYMP